MRTANRVLVLAVALAGPVVLGAGCGSTKTVTKTATVTTVRAAQTPPERQTLFGHVKSLQAKGGQLRDAFRPGVVPQPLHGERCCCRGSRAVEPGQPVPNDNYRVDEGHRLFTYKVPADAKVTVITKAPTGTPITVSHKADIEDGTSKLKLFEPLESGVLDRRPQRHHPLNRPAVSAVEMGRGVPEEIRVGDLAIRFLVEGDESLGSVAVFEFDVPAGANVAAAHSHDGYEKTIYGLEGVLALDDRGDGDGMLARERRSASPAAPSTSSTTRVKPTPPRSRS